MSVSNPKSQKPNGFDDSEKRRHDKIDGQNNETNSSTPVPITTSTSKIPETYEVFKVKKQKSVGGESSNLQPKFSISLSKREIEEDLYALTGKRNLRCKKRRNQKIKHLFPGSSLDGHDAESLQKRHVSVSARGH